MIDVLRYANRFIQRMLYCAFAFAVLTFGTTNAAFAACGANQIDVNGDGTNCQMAKFSVTTTSLDDGDTFAFGMSAAGTFYVDWGDGSVQTLNRTGNTTYTTYSHEYSTGSVKTIRFGGVATGYVTGQTGDIDDTPTIDFGNYNWSSTPELVTSISGSLGALFPVLGPSDGQKPMFIQTFSGTYIASTPENLFSGITTGGSGMFIGTFRNCTELTSIPGNLFSGITTGASNMFSSTFVDCTGLTSIPGNLFSGITTGAEWMFFATFAGCTGLTSIPGNLFSGITTGASDMFAGTFYGCTGLTSLPSDLFSKITTSAGYMFENTFYGCTNLSGYIPPSTFAGLIANNHPTATDMWRYTFRNTQLATSCPSGTTQYTTGYESEWASNAGRAVVSCEPLPIYAITLDDGNATTSVDPGTVYLFYNDNWYTDVSAEEIIDKLDTVPAKSGYKFNGFFTEPNGAGTKIISLAGDFVTKSSALTFTHAPATIYADWHQQYTVTYSCGTGTGTAPDAGTATTGLTFTPAAPGGCTKSGYNFAGWAVSGTNTVRTNAFTWDYTENKTLTAQWTDAEFFITTTDLGANTTFSFYMSAAGSFTVNWGDGTIETITRTNNTTNTKYSHTYIGGGEYIISLSGTATAYNTSNNVGVMSFYDGTPKLVGSVTGTMGGLFPTLGAANGQVPRFFGLFRGCSNLRSIPSTLFSGVTGATPYMFADTFYGCTNLRAIPTGLFSGISGSAEGLFYETFYGCREIASEIPSGLFSGITAPARYMFYRAFYDTRSLGGYIPASLFSGLNGGTAPNMMTSIFDNSGLAEDCSDYDMMPKITGYEQYWDGHVACMGTEDFVAKFSVTTTELDDGDEFAFGMSAAGVFLVSWGDGTMDVIDRTGDTEYAVYSHEYESGGVYTIGFDGTPTEYAVGDVGRADDYKPTIAFGTDGDFIHGTTPEYVASVSGSLGALFPELGNNDNQIPNFAGAFGYCENLTSVPATLFSGLTGGKDMFCGTFRDSGLTSIPGNLFSGVTTGAEYMFANTFHGCTGLTSIPGNLFSGITTGAEYMFSYTFDGCTGLTSIPGNLFSGITAGAECMFNSTFRGCTGLTTIPDNLFSGITTGAEYMFNYTFSGCTGLTSIPGNLFSGITAGSNYMFANTFSDCAGLTSIPGNLFSGITTGADWMFNRTFMSSGLTSIPGNLFSGITTGAENMFYSTFHGCTGLTSIPGNLFSGITTGADWMFGGTFYGCTGLTSIPGNLFSGITAGAEYMFNSTFRGCTGLTTIPDNLFSGITTGAEYMFANTFRGCTGLTSIPGNLFSGITTGAKYMFNYTFEDCTNLSGYIPPSTFAGLIANNHPTASNMWRYTFRNTQLATSCPSGTTQYTTGYESAWNSGSSRAVKSCTPTTALAITLDSQSATTSAAPTTVYLDFGSGWYSDSGMNTTISTLTTVPTKTNYAFNGFWTASNGTGTQIVNANGQFLTTNAALTSVVTNATVYASWATPYTVTYSCGDGTGTAPAAAIALDGVQFTPAGAGGCAREGYIFTGWGVSGTNDIKTGAFIWNYGANKTLTAQWEQAKFSVTTTNLSAGDEFAFGMSAAGVFLVSWGDGTMDVIDRTGDTEYQSYSHEYDDDGVYTIGFAGTSTEYAVGNPSDDNYKPTIVFGNDDDFITEPTNNLVASISGSLGALFPELGNAANQKPNFAFTFYDCENLTSVPATLFSGLTGGKDMFYGTFRDCTGLTSIPGNLFSGITTGASSMFSYTFLGCRGLTSIPGNLFSGITTGADWMFNSTFYGCTGLTSIPGNLFSGIITGADWMFNYTFAGCTGLTSIPGNLFSGITTGAERMFNYTFSGCTNLSGYIPPSTFAGLIANNHPIATNMWLDTFRNTQLATSCPSGTTQYTTGYESAWNSGSSRAVKSCAPTTALAITLDSQSATTSAAPTTVYLDFGSGWYSDSGMNTTISSLTTVPAKTNYVFNGFWTAQNGSGTQIIDASGNFLATNAALTFTTTNATVYASWVTPYTVTYSCGDGTGTAPAAATALDGAQFTPAGAGGCSKSGYMFTGWAVSGTNDVRTGSFVWNYTSNKTLTAQWEQAKFSVTTTELDDGDEFAFGMSAAGVFLVSWGDGTVETINRTGDTEYQSYSHEYDDDGVYTIGFAGTATGYSTDTDMGTAITFGPGDDGFFSSTTPEYVASVSGALGSLFPELGNNDNRKPMFLSTFYGCENLTSVPANLFSGLTGGSRMFYNTFMYSGLTSIPGNLFSGITTGAEWMFNSTFKGCTGLTSIPGNLFSGITTGAKGVFSSTFHGCTGLTSIPGNLFSGITTGADWMFANTFSGCTNLSGYIPPSTFAGLITNNHPTATNMWWRTFYNTNLTYDCSDYDLSQFETGYEDAWEDGSGRTVVSCGAMPTCPSGQYTNPDTNQCTPCPIGSYNDGSVANACIPCQWGTTTSTTGASSCDATCVRTPGIRGYYDPEWDDENNTVINVCTPNACNGGYFPVVDGNNVTCVSCSEATGGTYPHSPGGGVSVASLEGTYNGDGRRACFVYRSEINGSHINAVGDLFVSACPAGSYSNYPEMEDEEDYETVSGQAIHFGESYACDTCAANTYSTGGATQCTACLENYTTFGEKTSPMACRISCPGGYYLANANDTECTPVGAGHWTGQNYTSQGTIGTYETCPTGLTNIGYGVGADEAGDCGRILHIGDYHLYLRSDRKTDRTLNVQIGNNIYYGNMAAADVMMSYGMNKSLKINFGNTTYSVYDDSGEGYIPEPEVVLELDPIYAAASTVPASNAFQSASGMNWSAIMKDPDSTELSGVGACSATTGANGAIAAIGFTPENAGTQCWCKITDPVEATRWVAATANASCSTKCGYYCANNMNGTKAKNIAYRTALYTAAGVLKQ